MDNPAIEQFSNLSYNNTVLKLGKVCKLLIYIDIVQIHNWKRISSCCFTLVMGAGHVTSTVQS